MDVIKVVQTQREVHSNIPNSQGVALHSRVRSSPLTHLRHSSSVNCLLMNKAALWTSYCKTTLSSNSIRVIRLMLQRLRSKTALMRCLRPSSTLIRRSLVEWIKWDNSRTMIHNSKTLSGCSRIKSTISPSSKIAWSSSMKSQTLASRGTARSLQEASEPSLLSILSRHKARWRPAATSTLLQGRKPRQRSPWTWQAQRNYKYTWSQSTRTSQRSWNHVIHRLSGPRRATCVTHYAWSRRYTLIEMEWRKSRQPCMNQSVIGWNLSSSRRLWWTKRDLTYSLQQSNIDSQAPKLISSTSSWPRLTRWKTSCTIYKSAPWPKKSSLSWFLNCLLIKMYAQSWWRPRSALSSPRYTSRMYWPLSKKLIRSWITLRR